jgi:hypothetical protein
MPRSRQSGSGWQVRAALLMAVATGVGCRFESRPPAGSAREDATLEGVVESLYVSLARHDTTLFDHGTFAAATTLLQSDARLVSLVPLHTMLDVPERRNAGGGVRIVRTELRPDGNVATARVVVASRDLGGTREWEATDVLTLAYRDATWRIAHAVFGPWRIRSAP